MESFLKASGEVHIRMFEKGVLVNELRMKNKVVDYGLIFMIQRILNITTRTITQMAIGKSSQPVDSQDKWLMAEAGRVNLTSATPSGSSIVLDATFGEGVGTADITELGVFLSDTGLLARTVIPVQTKTDTTTMQITWTITLQAS